MSAQQNGAPVNNLWWRVAALAPTNNQLAYLEVGKTAEHLVIGSIVVRAADRGTMLGSVHGNGDRTVNLVVSAEETTVELFVERNGISQGSGGTLYRPVALLYDPRTNEERAQDAQNWREERNKKFRSDFIPSALPQVLWLAEGINIAENVHSFYGPMPNPNPDSAPEQPTELDAC